MKKIKLIVSLTFMTVLIFGCSKDSDKNDEAINTSYNIVNNGNGGVNALNDDGDTSALKIAQAVPAVQNVTYPKSIPVLLFFNDKIYLNSLEEGIEVTQNGELIGGNIYVNEGANGYAIMTFIPFEPFISDTEISFKLIGVQDDAGNELEGGTYSMTFKVNDQEPSSFDGNGSFSSNDGVLFLGDGNILTDSNTCLYSGSSYAAITSGDQLISNESAIGGASSIMILGAIDSDISSLTFDYNFLSAEFQEYVDSEFDDSVVLTIVGPNNAYSEFITSVNIISDEGNTQCTNFPNMPDAGNDYAGSTGWINKTVNFPNVGSPAYVIFTVTDVSDLIYSSVLAVDNVSY